MYAAATDVRLMFLAGRTHGSHAHFSSTASLFDSRQAAERHLAEEADKQADTAKHFGLSSGDRRTTFLTEVAVAFPGGESFDVVYGDWSDPRPPRHALDVPSDTAGFAAAGENTSFGTRQREDALREAAEANAASLADGSTEWAVVVHVGRVLSETADGHLTFDAALTGRIGIVARHEYRAIVVVTPTEREVSLLGVLTTEVSAA